MKFLVTDVNGTHFGTIESKGNTLKGAMMEFKAELLRRCPVLKGNYAVYFRHNVLTAGRCSFILKEVEE